MQLLQVYDYIAVEMEEVRELFDWELHSDEPMVADLLAHVGKFRGKMLRPMLVLLSSKGCGEVTRKHHVIAAVAEMVHMSTLVHDDVLDEADQRRRGRTINALHGNEAAVILGDLLISHAFHLCSSLDSQQASRLISATTNTVCEGELMQLYYRGYYDLTEDKYLAIVLQKTASLIATCCYLGAQASGAREDTCQALEQYGRNLGIAFQIMDDVTDLTGNEQTAGKTLGSDFLKEKLTLPGIHYLSNCSPAERQQLCEMLSRRSSQDYQEYAHRLHEAGSVQYARQQAASFIDAARHALPATLNKQTYDLLMELASLVVA